MRSKPCSMRRVAGFTLLLALVCLGGAAADAAGGQTDLSRQVSQLASDAMLRLDQGVCTDDSCDPLTGCNVPNKDRTQLQLFQACRVLVLFLTRSMNADPHFSSPAGAPRDAEFAARVMSLNGDIFWAPASKSTEIVTNFGDEARAVFGPIPDADCGKGAATIRLEVDGNSVDLKPNPGKPGNPLEFEHRDAAGRLVKWTTTVPQCDKPSLAGGFQDTYCPLNSRMSRVVRGKVEWVTLCRKTTGEINLSTDPSWQSSDPRFALLGTIGFNEESGEIVFFDGREDGFPFDWSKPFGPPGGKSYGDGAGRAASDVIYDTSFISECSFCHDNKNPHVVNPHIGLKRVGYRDDALKAAFGLDDGHLPWFMEREKAQDAPFRVIGSAYTATYYADLRTARSVVDPTGHCTRCHLLTTQATGRRFAADAVGKKPFASNQQDPALQQEISVFKADAHFRTTWATEPGGIVPWMVLEGNELGGTTHQISDPDWEKLSECLWGNGGSACGYKPLYTKCPKPESRESDSSTGETPDPSGPTALAAAVVDEPGSDRLRGKDVRVTWKYLNSLGDVPERDDVRFNIAIKEADIPEGQPEPSPRDYPTMDEVQSKQSTPIDGDIGRLEAGWLIQNASYAGHLRWTEPAPAAAPRDYRVDFPAVCGKRYLIRISPKRFCFDRSDQVFGEVDHVAFADVVCDRVPGP
jgi:hypothetical protein